MPILRLAVALTIGLSFFAACEKPHSQTSNLKAESDEPTHSASSEYDQTLRSIKSIVAKHLSLDANAIDIDAPLSKQKVAADELDVVEIIMNIEDTFGVQINDEEISSPQGNLKDDLSIRKLADIVAGKRKG